MIQKIRLFVAAQRFYLAVLAGLCLIYLLLFRHAHSAGAPQSPESPQYQAFKQAEKQFQTDLNSEGSLAALFDRNPVNTVLFLGFSGLFGILFLGGCFLITLLLISKKFRSHWLHFYPLEDKTWPAALLLRVLVHFLVLSLLLNLLLSTFVWLFPGINANVLALVHTGIMDAAVAVILFAELGFSWKSVKAFGFDLKGRSARGEIFFGLSGYMAVIPFFAVLLWGLITLAQKLSYEPEPHPLVDVFLSQEVRDQWMIGFSIFLACLWGPFFEEIFFRGLCYPIFKQRVGALPGGILSALFFAFIHRNEFAFFPIFLLGLGLVLLYEKRGNLIAPIALHIFHNSLFIGYFFTAKALMAQG
ncbi:MAG: CPBP family intramembrane metalloprotease [Candidatus Omnitrophica bacterium]|nr:CPBP family intramembrane metalloprotease [Candidatus Omnitrophota bacterium]